MKFINIIKKNYNRFHSKINIIFIIIFVFLSYMTTPESLINIFKNKKIIFTFWEPRGKIPGYLQLCIQTWRKYLPEYQIKVMDYKKSKIFLGEKLFDSIICKNMSLPIQADAIRVALLAKFGGIWMDTDIIIINGNFINNLKKYEISMIGDDIIKIQNIGFIYASYNSSILDYWLKMIILKVKYFKKVITEKNSEDYNNPLKKIKIWNYLGNGIIDEFLSNIQRPKYNRIDKNKLNIFPEIKFYKNSTVNVIKKYQSFYFNNGNIESILNNSKYIIR